MQSETVSTVSGEGGMLHSYTTIYIHLIWSTKEREPLLMKNIRPAVQEHIVHNAISKGIAVECISIQRDHAHLLVSLSSEQRVDDIVKLIKGESSHWINSENLIPPKFSWQRGYGAFSISPSHLAAVRKYIGNQDEHHRKRSYGEEVEVILGKYGYSGSETPPAVDGRSSVSK
jgi:putative transposase